MNITGFDPYTGTVDLEPFFNGGDRSSIDKALWSQDLARVASSTWVGNNIQQLTHHVDEFRSLEGLMITPNEELVACAQVRCSCLCCLYYCWYYTR